MTLLKTPVETSKSAQKIRAILDDGQRTTVYISRYQKTQVKPRLVLFKKETNLLDWCAKHEISDAMGGGFFVRELHRPLGDMWIGGVRQATVSFINTWNEQRGSVYIQENGQIRIAPRYLLPQAPKTDLLQAGPLLLQAGQVVIQEGDDPEGFSAGSYQFDSDITAERHPRAAIGTDKDYIYSIACDGRARGEAGLTLPEFAEILKNLGINDALNLDGGSSTTLIAGSKVQNKPRSDTELFETGRPIFSAIVFESIQT